MKNDAERGSLMKSDTDIPCVQLSTEQQATAIEAACKAANLDAHITRITAKSRAATWAEKLAVRFKLDREDLVVKNSYMYCDALDTFSLTEACSMTTPRPLARKSRSCSRLPTSATMTLSS